mmetsp:Transcript_90813/g.151994  ORF Transcript_90813/g.151994 Transcript_90813/m.151994 type:complete len:85 (+) Transcript_90813:148-402(+)
MHSPTYHPRHLVFRSQADPALRQAMPGLARGPSPPEPVHQHHPMAYSTCTQMSEGDTQVTSAQPNPPSGGSSFMWRGRASEECA